MGQPCALPPQTEHVDRHLLKIQMQRVAQHVLASHVHLGLQGSSSCLALDVILPCSPQDTTYTHLEEQEVRPVLLNDVT